jgi:hydroxyacylglutathione hydrolase
LTASVGGPYLGGMLRTTFPVGVLGCNCTVIADETSREAIVIDPGDEAARILTTLAKDGLRAVALVHTHAHIDHVGATERLVQVTGARPFLHEGDVFLHEMIETQAELIGLPTPEHGPISGRLVDGEALRFGRYELGVIHTPGHTPGSVCFTVAGEDVCFSGDTLFNGGIGRTDLWGGDMETLVASIKHRLYNLNGAVEVVPGHGPSTTIDREKRANPFVRA